jgi:hypothetical protein
MSGVEAIKYRAQFMTRPDLDTEDFRDYTRTVAVGQEIAIQADDGKPGRVAEIKSDSSSRETIVFEPV